MLSSREDFDTDENDDDEVKRMMTLKRRKIMNGLAEENMIASFSEASQTSVQAGVSFGFLEFLMFLNGMFNDSVSKYELISFIYLEK